MDNEQFVNAVERFDVFYNKNSIPQNQNKYIDLIPSRELKDNEQYSFEVDLDKCTGCKACVTACHNENGLDEDETWRSVGIIQGKDSNTATLQHITTACHHCLEPACMTGCPTLAYVKDEKTGIVKHLDDQCFGCQYCILKCPYEAPKYNQKKGIVRKCDMCIDRLEAGQPTACSKACPNEAIKIRIINKTKARDNFDKHVNLPEAPDSEYTYPTTTYKTTQKFPKNTKSQENKTTLQGAHLPLVFMLTLTQLAVGSLLIQKILKLYIPETHTLNINKTYLMVSLSLGLLGMGASVLHLGRPLLAFRAILGFRTSWLSREILCFGVFAQLAILYSTIYWFFFLNTMSPNLIFTFNVMENSVIFLGLLGIFCSIKVYKDTLRPFWNSLTTDIKFFGTSMILGSSVILMIFVIFTTVHSNIMPLGIFLKIISFLSQIVIISTITKLLIESSIFLLPKEGRILSIEKTVILMKTTFKKHVLVRYFLGICGGILFPLSLSLIHEANTSIIILLSCFIVLFSFLGELIERFLFFKTSVPLKMPGS